VCRRAPPAGPRAVLALVLRSASPALHGRRRQRAGGGRPGRVACSSDTRRLTARLRTLAQVESIKAGGIAVAGGLFGALPVALATGEGGLQALLALGAAAASCLLFGVTYRWARARAWWLMLRSRRAVRAPGRWRGPPPVQPPCTVPAQKAPPAGWQSIRGRAGGH
jgi:hypothetical protein